MLVLETQKFNGNLKPVEKNFKKSFKRQSYLYKRAGIGRNRAPQCLSLRRNWVPHALSPPRTEVGGGGVEGDKLAC
jgi:hypothetical protein